MNLDYSSDNHHIKKHQTSTHEIGTHEPGIERRSIPSDTTTTGARTRQRSGWSIRDSGQATTEYALVMLGAALVGVLVIGWATSGGGAAAINRLFNAVLDSVMGNL